MRCELHGETFLDGVNCITKQDCTRLGFNFLKSGTFQRGKQGLLHVH